MSETDKIIVRVEAAKKALETERSAESWHRYSVALANSFSVFRKPDDVRLAFQASTMAEKKYTNPNGKAKLLIDRAAIHRYRGSYASAKSEYIKALELDKSLAHIIDPILKEIQGVYEAVELHVNKKLTGKKMQEALLQIPNKGVVINYLIGIPGGTNGCGDELVITVSDRTEQDVARDERCSKSDGCLYASVIDSLSDSKTDPQLFACVDPGNTRFILSVYGTTCEDTKEKRARSEGAGETKDTKSGRTSPSGLLLRKGSIVCVPAPSIGPFLSDLGEDIYWMVECDAAALLVDGSPLAKENVRAPAERTIQYLEMANVS